MTELGTVLDGKYEILKKVGQGGMSIVYLAMDNRLNKQWAVKEIKNDGSKSVKTLLKSLEREANILKNVDHPVLPRIVDILNENGIIYVVMDFVEGKPLSDVLKAEGAQDQTKVIEWGRALASALDYLHSMNPPIIYRDMKPSNVMLKPDGSVKLIDFGTAKEYIVENNADTTALGTRGYAAPEQFGDAQGRGIYNTDARTDIYNLGATLYHLVTGKNPCEPPYEIKPIRQWNPALSSGFEQIIVKCCQADPKDRYQSCSELLYALDHYNELDNEYRSKSKKKVALFAAMAGLSLISVGCSVLGFLKKDQLREQNYEAKVAEADDALAIGDIDGAIEAYKAAISLDTSISDAYLGLLRAYAYYYTGDTADAGGEGAETGAEIGVRYVIRYIDDVQDDVIYEVASLYYDEIQDYKTARQYFAMVDDDKYADDVAQAEYYLAICDNKIDKNANFVDAMDKIFSFEEYNRNDLDDSNANKYINYLNIANIYVDNLDASDDMPERAINLLNEANEGLDDNSTALSNVFPEDKGVQYYTGQYARDLYAVYIYMSENSEDNEEIQSCYMNAIDAINRYVVTLEVAAEDVDDSTKNQYASYMTKEAEAYVALAQISSDASYYDRAEDVFQKAEETLGNDSYSADIYVSHLNYLYERYSAEYGTDPGKWRSEGGIKVQEIYEAGTAIISENGLVNNKWNSLINNAVISSVININYSGAGAESEE